MKAKFYLGPKDGAVGKVQTSNGCAPNLYQFPVPRDVDIPTGTDEILSQIRAQIYYYDLQKVEDNVAYYKYRCTA